LKQIPFAKKTYLKPVVCHSERTSFSLSPNVKGERYEPLSWNLSRIAQASMTHGRNGSEIGITFGQSITSPAYRSNPTV
jgi:hypothetical protein